MQIRCLWEVLWIFLWDHAWHREMPKYALQKLRSSHFRSPVSIIHRSCTVKFYVRIVVQFMWDLFSLYIFTRNALFDRNYARNHSKLSGNRDVAILWSRDRCVMSRCACAANCDVILGNTKMSEDHANAWIFQISWINRLTVAILLNVEQFYRNW